MTFKAGKSGNPSGRPKGIQDRRAKFRTMIEPKSEELLNTAVEMALGGNEAMLRLLLDRILPAKPREDSVDLNLPNTGLTEQMEVILSSLNERGITPTEALKLMNMTVAQSKIIEFDQIEKRIKALEAHVKDRVA